MVPSSRSATPTPRRMLWRGITRRCPMCGSAGIVERWFTIARRCDRCGLPVERLDGHWTGAIGINTIVTFTAMFVVILGGALLSWNEPRTATLAIVATVVAVGLPIAFYPSSRTLWLAIDLLMRPLEPDELASMTLPDRRAPAGDPPE